MSFLKRQPGGGKDSVVPLIVDPWLSRKYPALWEYMTADRWPDGESRTTSSLLLFYAEGQLRACLNDRDAGASLWATAEGLEEALQSLEDRLADGSGEWRKNAYNPKNSKKK